jgi:hypothetical protein
VRHSPRPMLNPFKVPGALAPGLRAYYAGVAREPIPERLTELAHEVDGPESDQPESDQGERREHDWHWTKRSVGSHRTRPHGGGEDDADVTTEARDRARRRGRY